MDNTKKSNKLAIKGNYNITSPSAMANMAVVLKKHVITQGLFTNIAGKNYAHVEGWQFAGGLMGMFPKVKSVTNLSAGTEKKWMAEVEIIRLKDNAVVGFGVAICSSLESKKKSFDEYAILSMAQTRAIGKAYRNLIGFVMKMAGYEATPKEEMINHVGEFKPMVGEVVNTVPVQKVDTGLDTDYAIKLKSEVIRMNSGKEMTDEQILAFINKKLGTAYKNVSKAGSQIILAQLLQKGNR